MRKLLKRLGFPERSPEQLPLPGGDPNLSASPAAAATTGPELLPSPGNPNLSAVGSADDEPLPVSFDPDPADRRGDRLLAYLGVLEDAAPLFRSGPRVPHAGVLLALPALVVSGVFTSARPIYGSLGPAFYGLRTTLVALLLMALLRIKRPEGLKEHAPGDLGRVLGLDRAPEVKTVRRKLRRLAAAGRAPAFGRALAQRRVADRGAALGFLYVDGHVRVSHGQRTLPKAHVARRRLALPATTDYWVNDAVGEPLFVVTAEANAGLVQMLPDVLAEIRTLVGERRVTVVFDRGGYSPKLFLQLLAEGFDLLTYRRGRSRPVPRARFTRHEAVLDGTKVCDLLADQGVRLLGGTLRLRQVTRLTDTGHQTPILTSRRDLPAVEVAFRMFERWRQENFFKVPAGGVRPGCAGRLRGRPRQPRTRGPQPEAPGVDRQAGAGAWRVCAAHGGVRGHGLAEPGTRPADHAGLQDCPREARRPPPQSVRARPPARGCRSRRSCRWTWSSSPWSANS